MLAKSSTKSTVYRPSYLDYVAVRRFGPDGQVTGEYRFLGLYTQAAYTESITRIPVLRRKLDEMLEAAGLPADSHDGKDLIEILEGYPREELFEISAEQLTPIALAVLGLGERKQVRLFLRPDAYGRYVSCLVYLPRDRYTTQVRLRAQEILRKALRRRLGRLQRDGQQLGARPAARGGARRAGPPAAQGRPARAAGRDRGRDPLLGRGPRRGGRAPARHRACQQAAAHLLHGHP